MKRKKKLILAIVLMVVVFSATGLLQHVGGSSKNYKKGVYVSNVVDGDTIELSNGEIVRYIGIDTPELRKKEGSRWVYAPMPYAEAAADFNRKFVEGKSVKLEFDVQKMDRYNRLLAYVYAGSKMVNLEMVREGYAMIYSFPPNIKYGERFLEAQNEARDNNRGLWKDLARGVIFSSEAKKNIGLIKAVETEVMDTYISEKVLILNCRDNFKVVIFKGNFKYFPKMLERSPHSYFRYKTIRVYGVIKDYKGSCEIVLHDPSQLEILAGQ